MNLITRSRCLALVLMIFISQTALLIHVTGHVGKDNVKCVLCVCQGQQAHSLPVHNFYLALPQVQFSKPDTVRLLTPVRNTPRSYFQRAPPVLS